MVHRSGTGKVSETAWRTDYLKPSQSPSDVPSLTPSQSPSLKPSQSPSDVPSLTPSQSPSACINTISMTVAGLDYKGNNDCQDNTGRVYDYVQVDAAGVITTVEACYTKCNSIVDWSNVGRGLFFSCALDVCLCYFDDGFLPDLPSNCAAKYHKCESSNSGTGAVTSTGGSSNGKCFAKSA